MVLDKGRLCLAAGKVTVSLAKTTQLLGSQLSHLWADCLESRDCNQLQPQSSYWQLDYLNIIIYHDVFLCNFKSSSERWWTSARSDRSCSELDRSRDNWFCRFYKDKTLSLITQMTFNMLFTFSLAIITKLIIIIIIKLWQKLPF